MFLIEKNNKILTIDITNASDEEKKKLRGTIRYFNGDKNNVNIQIKIGNEIKHCGQIYLTDEILTIFETIIGKKNIY